jgi:hypothetical protein
VLIPALDDLLAFAADLTDEGSRASALIDLVPRLPTDRLDTVLDVAFLDEHQRTRVMQALLARATPAQIVRIRSATGQLTRLWPRHFMLVALLPYLREDERAAVVEKLVATLERRPAVELHARVRELTPILRPDQLDRLIAVGLRGEDRSFFRACMWDHLPDSRLAALVSAVCAEPAAFHSAMGGLAARLDGEQLAALHAAAHTIGDDRARSEALAAVARHLPRPERAAALTAAVTAAVTAMEAQAEPWNRMRLDALLPQADHDQVGVLLAAERAARVRGMDSNFTAITPFATPSQLAAAVAAEIAPIALGEPLPESAPITLTAGDLVKVIPHLPEDLRDLAVRTVLPRFDPLMYRIPRLTADQAAELLSRINGQDAPWQVARTIGYLAPFLGPARHDEAMAAVLAIEDDRFLGEALIELAPCLDPAHLAQAVRAATGIRDADTRAYALVGLMPYVDEPGIAQAALSAALSVPDPEARARRLLEVAAVLPAGHRDAALGSAWAALVTMRQGLGQGVIFEKLAGLLPTN